MKRKIPIPNIGEYWKAFSTDLDDDTAWLFLIVYKTTIKHKHYFLAVKCDWKTKKPIIDSLEELAQVWWFDSNGKGPEEFFLAESNPGPWQQEIFWEQIGSRKYPPRGSLK